MTHADVQAWLDRYVDAWLTYEPGRIADLFSEGVEYRYHPSDEPVVGRDAVVRSWTEPAGQASGRDAPGTYQARYEPYAIDGQRAVAVGRSDYFEQPGGPIRETYDNCFLLRFDADGRCDSFTEFFIRRPPG